MSLLVASLALASSGVAQERSLAEAIDAAREGHSYSVLWNCGADVSRDGWGAEHPQLDLRARFVRGAIEVEPASAPSWRWSLQLASLGRSGDSLSLDSANVAVDGDVVELKHGSADETFVHCERGWEHTLSIPSRPAGSSVLELRFALATDLAPVLDADARGVAFFDGCGQVALDYSGLAVWDANGHRVPAHFELALDTLRIAVDDSGAQYPLLVDPLITTNETKLVPSGGIVNASAGYVVAMDGNVAVVEEVTGSFTQHFVVFERGTGGWSQTAAINVVAPNVDLDGEWLLIGDGYFGWTGQAWLYHHVGTQWIYTPGLESPAPNMTCEPQTFGIGLAIDRDTAVVCETERTCPWSPSFYVAEFNAATQAWRYQWRVPIATYRVALDGDDLLIATAHVVQHYHRSAFGLPFVFSSTVCTSAPAWSFEDIALRDGIAAVRYDSLKVEIYEQLHGTFRLVAIVPLDPPTSGFYDRQRTSIADGVVAVGDPFSDYIANDAGAVQLWSRNAGWRLTSIVTASDAAAGDRLGASIGLDLHAAPGTVHLLAGAPSADIGGTSNRGAAYVFDLAHQGAQIYCTSKINSLSCVPRVGFTGNASASSSAPFTITCSAVINERNGVFFYGTSGRLATPFQGGYRCVASPTHRAGQMFSGGNTGTLDCSGAFTLDFNARIQSGVDPNLIAGAVVDGQFWYRDGPASFGTGLSEAIEFAIAP